MINAMAIVFDQQKHILLAHRRDKDLWELPSGGMELGELPTDAVVRETKEETGLDVRLKKLFAVGITPENVVGFCFYCDMIGGSITAGDESDDVRFFDTNGLPDKLSPRKRAVIQLALEHPPEIVFLHVNFPRV